MCDVGHRKTQVSPTLWRPHHRGRACQASQHVNVKQKLKQKSMSTSQLSKKKRGKTDKHLSTLAATIPSHPHRSPTGRTSISPSHLGNSPDNTSQAQDLATWHPSWPFSALLGLVLGKGLGQEASPRFLGLLGPLALGPLSPSSPFRCAPPPCRAVAQNTIEQWSSISGIQELPRISPRVSKTAQKAGRGLGGVAWRNRNSTPLCLCHFEGRAKA
jgi:hypothetical protein